MHDEELLSWLKTVISNERYDLLQTCIDTLYVLDHTGMTELSNNTLALVGDETNDNLHDKFINELVYLQVTQIRQFSITIDTQRLTLASVGPLNAILDTLYQLDKVDDTVALADILGLEESPEMTIALLVVFYHPTYSADGILEYLAYVPSALIDKIGDENPMQVHGQPLRVTDAARTRLAIGLNEPLIKTPVTQYLDQGGVLGMELDKYLVIHFKTIGVMDDYNEIANSWVMLLLYTGLPIAELRTLYPQYLEKLYELPDQIKQIHQRIKALLELIETKEREYATS